MPTFDLVDFGKRLTSVLPASWFPSTSLVAGGALTSSSEVPIADLLQGIGSGFAGDYAEIAYTQLQTRIATATDTNLDQISIDFFGGVLPRVNAESDASFRARIMQLVIAPQPTIPGLQQVLASYLKALLAAPRATTSLGLDTAGGMDTGQGAFDVTLPQGPAPVVQPLAADTQGSLDNYGFTDQPGPTGGGPSVYVFDQQSDPQTSAFLGIVPPQFCVAILYPGVSTNLLRIASTPYTQQFATLVAHMQAEGSVAVYATNGP